MRIHVTRRDVLVTLTGGAAAFVAARRISAQAGNPRRIDVHHHYAPPPDPNSKKKGGGTAWTPALALEQMDKHGIEATIFSRPGGESEEGGEKARTFVRRSNEYIAKVVSDNPKRFGFFAVIGPPSRWNPRSTSSRRTTFRRRSCRR
jgi:predicted TIM-barrel fold metal-dependent hydrolase